MHYGGLFELSNLSAKLTLPPVFRSAYTGPNTETSDDDKANVGHALLSNEDLLTTLKLMTARNEKNVSFSPVDSLCASNAKHPSQSLSSGPNSKTTIILVD